MVACSASNNHDAIRVVPDRLAEHIVESRPALIINAPGQALAHYFGLLVNLLEHEVLVSALLSRGNIPVNVQWSYRKFLPIKVRYPHPFGQKYGNSVILKNDYASRIGEESRNVACQHGLPFAKANDQGRSIAGANNLLRLALADHNQGIGSAQTLHCTTNGFLKSNTFRVLAPDHMSGNFRIRITSELTSLLSQFGLEVKVVLNYPVMNDRDLFELIEVRMGILISRRAVGCPA